VVVLHPLGEVAHDVRVWDGVDVEDRQSLDADAVQRMVADRRLRHACIACSGPKDVEAALVACAEVRGCVHASSGCV
jgi:hypothetical protein